MFDAVINHISAQSDWFQGFLRGEPPFSDYFVVPEPGADVTAVFRPRALPLLTDVQTAAGPRRVWTTFSADQIDLNFANPDVLLKISELLLFYVAQGARLIRLDAIAFMWKEAGTELPAFAANAPHHSTMAQHSGPGRAAGGADHRDECAP
ncbi:alpha-amylase family glycosyl hydrolase [Candidatus Amarobacter glycogenicus]|uniref:alpha-amylase family glycosyl hydrolase n=1 Tax=Candidatus Amarobacter glycogenicus TaxID=3140699 RepID=UPI002A1793FF|nr:hypothetical protein [Dehalococcoidia bacterium]